MRFLVFADIHAMIKWQENIKGGSVGTLPSKIKLIISNVRQVYEHALEHKIEYIFFAGDLFHVRGSISVPFFNALYILFGEMKDKGVRTVLIPGNHDTVSSSNTEHSLLGFEKVTEAIVQSTRGWYIDGVNICCTPWSVEVTPPSNDDYFHVLISHKEVQGAKMGALEYATDRGLKVSAFKGYQLVLLGHIHKPQTVRKSKPCIKYVGSLISHNFEDVEDVKGFLDITIEDKKASIKRIPTKSPGYLVFNKTILNDAEIVKDNHIRIDNVDLKEEAVVRRKLGELGALSVVFSKKRQVVEVKTRVDFNKVESLPDILKVYTKEMCGELDDQKLITIAEEVMEQVDEGII